MGCIIDLSKKEHSYFIGFVQADGHHRRNGGRGCLSIELNIRDIDILNKFRTLFSISSTIHTRKRTTNFKEDAETATLTFFDKTFRDELIKNKVPHGRKSDIIEPPDNVDAISYIRGLVDADGSLGITGSGKPFISLCTSSEKLKEYFCNFVEEITGVKSVIKRNARDNIYNICIMNTKAKMLAECLFKNCPIGLERKNKQYENIINLQLKHTQNQTFKRTWSDEEIEFVKTHTLEESITHINRSAKSIKIKLFRLRKGNNGSSN
jgi:hypothetical protein